MTSRISSTMSSEWSSSTAVALRHEVERTPQDPANRDSRSHSGRAGAVSRPFAREKYQPRWSRRRRSSQLEIVQGLSSLQDESRRHGRRSCPSSIIICNRSGIHQSGFVRNDLTVLNGLPSTGHPVRELTALVARPASKLGQRTVQETQIIAIEDRTVRASRANHLFGQRRTTRSFFDFDFG